MSELTATVSGSAAEHPELIEGLDKVYGELIELGYVHNTEIQVPPHGSPKDPIDMSGLRQRGLDPSTVELIGRLPWFTTDMIHEQHKLTGSRDGIPIGPSCAATSYFLGGYLPEGFRNTGDELLPSSAFQITKAVGSHGWNLAYDLESKTLIKWLQYEWNTREQLPVASFFETWTQKLRSQEWRAIKTRSGWYLEVLSIRSSTKAPMIIDPVSQQRANEMSLE